MIFRNHRQRRAIGQGRVGLIDLPGEDFHAGLGVATDRVWRERFLVTILAKGFELVLRRTVEAHEFFCFAVVGFQVLILDGPVTGFAFHIALRVGW